ncbi:hypothetical protein HF078_06890 [Bacillus sp. RO2]|uniref:hypothetical protein n=1 Tax=Bacillus sp. RO2 TaxID=2723913 RepID=UPI00145E77A3|nr:hypothetical protein [Bacillus sp. RO2]NMH72792.1 hypothetical protein [Bacillus sp. RO2]
MNYVDYIDAVDILGCLHDKIESIIEKLESFRLTQGAKEKEMVKTELQDIKRNVKKHLDLFLHNDANIYINEYLIPTLSICSYILSKIGTNRINANSYKNVIQHFHQVQFYVQKYYKSILSKSY